MKVFELLRNNVAMVTEQQIIDKLRVFDWQYEFSEDARRVSRGSRELELLENMIYNLWKTNPVRAVQIWNENAPGFQSAKVVMPSFIFRLQSQEL